MNSSNVLRVVVFCLFWVFAQSHFCSAEDHLDSSFVLPKKRPADPNSISEAELSFLTRYYFRAEESLKERYENSKEKLDLFLPSGITTVLSKEGDESIIAKVLAELSGSLNEKQIESVKAKSQELARQIRQLDPEERDVRLLSILERSEWLGFVLTGTTPPNESLPTSKEENAFKKFKTEFLAAYKEVTKKNKKVLENIEKAKIGNKDAKTWLRENLDTKSFTRFLEGQKESGGNQLFEDVAEAVAWKDSQGNKYHDFQDANGKVKRLYVGASSKDHANHLAKFLKESPSSLEGFSLARKIEPGTPEIINLTKAPLQTLPIPNRPTQTTSLAAQALPIYQQNCLNCHQRENIKIGDFREAARRINLQGAGRMPPLDSPDLPSQDKETLTRFFLSNEPKTGF